MSQLTRRRIQAEQSVKAFEKRGKRRILRALLCKSDGTFDVTGRDGFLYARLMRETGTQLAEVRNPISIQRIVNLPVLVEETSTGYVLLGIDTSDYFANPLANTVGSHADQHIIGEAATGGFDPLPIYNAALVNLHTRAQVTPDMTVHVEEGAHMTGGTWQYFAGANTAALVAPAGAGDARFDLVYIGSDNALHVVTGVEVTSPTVPTKPTVPVSATPVGWILLSNGDTAITQSMIYEPRVTAMPTLSTTPGTFAQGAGTLSVSTVNDATIADHTHAITSSSNPGAAASLLASDASGYLQLTKLGLGVASDGSKLLTVQSGGVIGWNNTTEIARLYGVTGLGIAGLVFRGRGNAAGTTGVCLMESYSSDATQKISFELWSRQIGTPANYAVLSSDSGTFTGLLIGNDGEPAGYLDVIGKFIVDSNGNITKLNNVTTSFPAANAAGYLTNNGTGTFTYSATATPSAHAIDSATHTVAGRTAGQVLIATAATTFGWSGFLLSGTTGGTTNLAVTNTKTLTLTATDDYNLTIPATGTAALLEIQNAFALTTTDLAAVEHYEMSVAYTLTAADDAPGSYEAIKYNMIASVAAGKSISTLAGVVGQVTFSGDTVSQVYSNQATYLQYGGTASQVDNFNTSVNLFGGTVALWSGLRVAAPVIIAGAITEAHGITIENITAGGTNYAIYTGTGTVRFGDTVKLPSAIFSSSTDVIAIEPTVNTTGTGSRILWKRASDSWIPCYISELYVGGVAYDAAITFNVNAGSGVADLVEAMRISGNGNLVAIGKTVPAAKLDIGGQSDVKQLAVTGFTTQAVATPMVQFTRNDTAAGVSAMLGLTAFGSGANGDGGSILMNGKTSTTAATAMALDAWSWVDATHASRKAKRVFSVYDTAVRECVTIEADGAAADFYFSGGDGSGLPYGSCSSNDVDINWTQASAVQNTWYDISDADMVDGQLNLVTHDGNGQLTVTKAGRYKIDYVMTFEASGANVHIETAISVSGTENAQGVGHQEARTANTEYQVTGTAILDLAASATINVSIRTTDNTTPNLKVDMIDLTVFQLGGT